MPGESPSSRWWSWDGVPKHWDSHVEYLSHVGMNAVGVIREIDWRVEVPDSLAESLLQLRETHRVLAKNCFTEKGRKRVRTVQGKSGHELRKHEEKTHCSMKRKNSVTLLH